MSREAVKACFVTYRAAVLAESAARDEHYWTTPGPRRPKADTDRRLIEAIGKLCEARAALDAAILDAHTERT